MSEDQRERVTQKNKRLTPSPVPRPTRRHFPTSLSLLARSLASSVLWIAEESAAGMPPRGRQQASVPVSVGDPAFAGACFRPCETPLSREISFGSEVESVVARHVFELDGVVSETSSMHKLAHVKIENSLIHPSIYSYLRGSKSGPGPWPPLAANLSAYTQFGL